MDRGDSIIRRRRAAANRRRAIAVGVVLLSAGFAGIAAVCGGVVVLTMRRQKPAPPPIETPIGVPPSLAVEPGFPLPPPVGAGRIVVSGVISSFALGDDIFEFIKAAQGEPNNLRPALKLMTQRHGELICRFRDGQEGVLIKYQAGQSLAVEGKLDAMGMILDDCVVR